MFNRKSLAKKTRFEIFKRDKFTCQYCGKSTPSVILEIDHVIPVSKGGNDLEENLITSCFECNRGKGDGLLNSILKDKDIHTETLILAEKELQLSEYNFIKGKIREREDKELDIIKDKFIKQFNYPHYAEEAFNKILSVIRKSLKYFSYIDILEYVDYAIERTEKDSRGEYHNVAAAKYLMGILRNKIKGFEERDN